MADDNSLRKGRHLLQGVEAREVEFNQRLRAAIAAALMLRRESTDTGIPLTPECDERVRLLAAMDPSMARRQYSPTTQALALAWLQERPDATAADCALRLGISKNTIARWAREWRSAGRLAEPNHDERAIRHAVVRWMQDTGSTAPAAAQHFKIPEQKATRWQQQAMVAGLLPRRRIRDWTERKATALAWLRSHGPARNATIASSLGVQRSESLRALHHLANDGDARCEGYMWRALP